MDIFDTTVLTRVVSDIPTPPQFVLDMFFPVEETSEAETIMFDVDKGRPRISPFVSPLVEGKIISSRGYATKSFAPAYVKDKRVFNPNRAFRRTVGEKIGGTLSPAQRIMLAIANDLMDQTDMLHRRFEVMACEAVRTGKATIVGEEYPAVVVDFGREADLTRVLTGGDRWDETGVSPMQSLEDHVELVAQASGVAPTDAIMDPKAWKLFKADPKFKDAVDTNIATLNEARTRTGITIIGRDNMRLMAVMGDLRIWVYFGKYLDPVDGQEKQYIPDYTVVVGSRGIEGVRHFGAIKDIDVLRAMKMFPKSWKVEDPSARYIMMQSAPLMVPYRVNAAGCLTVR